MTKIIYAVGLDADGHIYHTAYRKDPSDSEDKAIRHNVPLFDHIRAKAELLGAQGDEVEIRVFVFSRRQSQAVDLSMSFENNTGLFFKDIQMIATHLGAKLEKVLLADYYGGSHLREGQSFENAEQDPYGADPSREHAAWCDDQSKFTILYPILHKIANEDPKAKIYCDVLDDNSVILDNLSAYCATYPVLFPESVEEVVFAEYAGKHVDTRRPSMTGEGIIDANYRATVLQMSEICREKIGKADVEISEVSIDACKHIHPDLLTQRQSYESPEEITVEAAEVVVDVAQVAEKIKVFHFARSMMFRPVQESSTLSAGPRLNGDRLIADDERDARPSSAPF